MTLHMKSKNIILTAMLTALPSVLMAQENIQKAFDALRLSDYQEETMSSHHVDKTPETGVMEGMSDEYEFKITKENEAGKQLITDIRNAFTKDRDAAYRMSSGSQGGAEAYTSLAVGDGNSGGVPIGQMKDSKWIYACFLDPADSEQIHRYAYGFEWVEKNNGTIIGRMVKTYATTQKHRQGKRQMRVITVNGNNINVDGQSFPFGSGLPYDKEPWLYAFNTYKNLFLKNPDATTASHYATSIYKLCKNADSLEEAEKNLVITEIKKMKTKTTDEFIQQLFDMSVEQLKK